MNYADGVSQKSFAKFQIYLSSIWKKGEILEIVPVNIKGFM